MIVEPTLLEHPKFLALKREFGPRALEYLIAIWKHCQQDKRGENWGRKTPAYVEAVAGYHGPASKLYKALLSPLNEGGSGFIEVNSKEEVIIHDWNDTNKSLVINWYRNPSGRKSGLSVKKPETPPDTPEATPRGSPQGTHGVLNGQPDRTGQDRTGQEYPLPPADAETFGEEKSEPVIPTPQEMMKRLMTYGLSTRTAEKYHAWHTEKQTWLIPRQGRLILRDWEREVKEWQERDRSQANAGRAGKTLKREEAESELDRVRAELQWQENKERKAILSKRWEELETLIGASA